jgi:hypothetical protein
MFVFKVLFSNHSAHLKCLGNSIRQKTRGREKVPLGIKFDGGACIS